jgi:hypothetical protein
MTKEYSIGIIVVSDFNRETDMIPDKHAEEKHHLPSIKINNKGY